MQKTQEKRSFCTALCNTGGFLCFEHKNKPKKHKKEEQFETAPRDHDQYSDYKVFRYSMKFSLFSRAVVVGLPRSSLAPMEHIASMRQSSLLAFAF